MATDLRSALIAAATADPLSALIASGAFGKVRYAGGDAYKIYASDNSTLIAHVRAQTDTAGTLRIIQVDRRIENNESPAAVPGVPILRTQMMAAFAADPLLALLAAGTFGNITPNGNATYTIMNVGNKTVLCQIHATLDTQGNLMNFNVVRNK
jgi:hypothetical protein